jgi:hypothetical protein
MCALGALCARPRCRQVRAKGGGHRFLHKLCHKTHTCSSSPHTTQADPNGSRWERVAFFWRSWYDRGAGAFWRLLEFCNCSRGGGRLRERKFPVDVENGLPFQSMAVRAWRLIFFAAILLKLELEGTGSD